MRTKQILLALGLASAIVLTPLTAAVGGENAWDSPVDLPPSGGSAANPQLVTDGSTITAIWQDSDGSHWRMFTSSSTDVGATWSTPAILSGDGGYAHDPQLVTDGSTITAVWYRYDGSHYRIQSSSSTDGGATWSSTPATISDAGWDAYYPQLVTDGSTITAIWYGYDGSHYRIQSSSSTDGGATWISTPATISDAGGDSFNPQLVTDGGTITAIWYRYGGGVYTIQSSSSSDGGATWSSPPASLPGADNSTVNPQLVTNGSTITAVWYANDGSHYRIESSSSTDGGATWSSTPVVISEAGQNANSPQLVTDGSTITAVWQRYDGSYWRIESSSSSDGGATWSSPPAVLSEAGENASNPQLVTDGSTITAIWRYFDCCGYRIQASSYTSVPVAELSVSAPTSLPSVPSGDATDVPFTVSVNADAGPKSEQITFTVTLPAGPSFAATPSGTDWACDTPAVGALTTSCSYTPAAALAPGTVLPVVTVPVTWDGSGSFDVTGTASSSDAGAAAPASTTITMMPTAGAPVALQTVAYGAAETPITVSTTLPAPSGSDPFSYALVSTSPSSIGSASVDALTGDLEFTPAEGVSGTATITYSVTDVNGTSAEGTVTVTVAPKAIAPAGPATSRSGETTVYTPSTPVGSAPFTFRLVTLPSVNAGTATIDENTGVIEFTAKAGYTGLATLSYVVTDANGIDSRAIEVQFQVTQSSGLASTGVDFNPISVLLSMMLFCLAGGALLTVGRSRRHVKSQQ